MQQKQIAVGKHLIDEPIEQARPQIDLVGILPQLLEDTTAERVQPQVQLKQDVLLALEVVVERGLGDPQPLGDLPQRGLVVALLVEQLERHVQDPLAHLSPGASTPRWRLSPAGSVDWRWTRLTGGWDCVTPKAYLTTGKLATRLTIVY